MSAIWPLGCCNFHNLEIVVLLYLVLTRTSTNNKVGTIREKCLASLVFIARPLSAFLSQLVKTSAYIRHIDALSVVIVIAHADLDEVVAGVDTLLTIGNLDAGVWASAICFWPSVYTGYWSSHALKVFRTIVPQRPPQLTDVLRVR